MFDPHFRLRVKRVADRFAEDVGQLAVARSSCRARSPGRGGDDRATPSSIMVPREGSGGWTPARERRRSFSRIALATSQGGRGQAVEARWAGISGVIRRKGPCPGPGRLDELLSPPRLGTPPRPGSAGPGGDVDDRDHEIGIAGAAARHRHGTELEPSEGQPGVPRAIPSRITGKAQRTSMILERIRTGQPLAKYPGQEPSPADRGPG